MGTALAVTQQQSMELAENPRWVRIHNTDQLSRAVVDSWSPNGFVGLQHQRCVQCGEVIDPVILQNRLQYGMRADAATPYGVSR